MREHPYIEGHMPEQGTYLPECLDEVISPENPILIWFRFSGQLQKVESYEATERPEEPDSKSTGERYPKEAWMRTLL